MLTIDDWMRSRRKKPLTGQWPKEYDHAFERSPWPCFGSDYSDLLWVYGWGV